MNCLKVQNQIISWLKEKVEKANAKGFVVGVSGGVDSGLVSTLCAMTGLKTILIQLPINRKLGEISDRADDHCKMLSSIYDNTVHVYKHDLSIPYNQFLASMDMIEVSELAKANLASRMRMCSAYTFANTFKCLVVGTGNKVEDFGVGFFTKYGDGGVDISPIGDLLKCEVRELAKFVGVSHEIYDAVPTDELWADVRSDESAIGASYDELEWAMKAYDGFPVDRETLTDRQKIVYEIFITRHEANAHKMVMPPICTVDKN